MTGRFYIDGKDAYSEFGIFIAEGGYNELLSYAPLKAVESNDWPEEDGQEFDLSAPALDTRELVLKFAAHRVQRVGAFVELLSDHAYHTFDFRSIGRTYKLRLASQSALNLAGRLETFSLKFDNDFPLPDNYTYVEPQSDLVAQSGYELDARSLAEYGVYILKGSDAEIQKSPAVKKNLLQNLKGQHGATYDGEVVAFQTKEVKLSCLMRAKTMDEFWRNYNALLYDLIRPGERSLYVDNTGYEYPCYYKNCSTTQFHPVGRIWFQFNLTLVFTSFRVGDDEYLLASEDGEWVMSEDGVFAIDLRE